MDYLEKIDNLEKNNEMFDQRIISHINNTLEKNDQLSEYNKNIIHQYLFNHDRIKEYSIRFVTDDEISILLKTDRYLSYREISELKKEISSRLNKDITDRTITVYIDYYEYMMYV